MDHRFRDDLHHNHSTKMDTALDFFEPIKATFPSNVFFEPKYHATVQNQKATREQCRRDITAKNTMLVMLFGLVLKIWLQRRHYKKNEL